MTYHLCSLDFSRIPPCPDPEEPGSDGGGDGDGKGAVMWLLVTFIITGAYILAHEVVR